MLLLALTPLAGALAAPRPEAWTDVARATGWMWFWLPIVLATTKPRSCGVPAARASFAKKAIYFAAWPVAGLLLQIPAFLP
jgi:hypothetical protein